MATRFTKFDAIGTHWQIQDHCQLNDIAWDRVQQQISQRIEAFDQAYSRFRQDSLVTRMSQQPGRYQLPPDGYKLLGFYEKLYAATDGKLTPLIGQTMVDAGYDAGYSFQTKQLTSPPSWTDTIAYDKNSVTLNKNVLLDFGAAGKGYLVDIVAGILDEAGIRSYTINAGGDILHRSEDSETLAIGLENPMDTSEAIGIARLTNKSLCASAGCKRQWGTFHHIIDPSSLASPRQITAVWVVAADTMTADGIATALFFTEPSQLQKHFDFSYAILDQDMTLHHAKDFPARVFSPTS